MSIDNKIYLQWHSGSGKTTSLAVNALNVLDIKKHDAQCIVYCATYDASLQLCEVMMDFALTAGLGINVSLISPHKGHSHTHRTIDTCKSVSFSINRPIHVLIGTPNDLIQEVEIGRTTLRYVQHVFMDDADAYINWQKIQLFMKKLESGTKVVYLSTTINGATYNNLMTNRVAKMLLGKNDVFNHNIHQMLVPEPANADSDPLVKYRMVKAMADCMISDLRIFDDDQTIIFCSTRSAAQDLANFLKADMPENSVLVHTGDSSYMAREQTVYEFNHGSARILVATEVLSRSIDLPRVNAVINYDLPLAQDGNSVNMPVYINRIGRSGRFGKKINYPNSKLKCITYNFCLNLGQRQLCCMK